MHLHDLKTPSLILDYERMSNNCRRMAERVRFLGSTLRPHVKTHKCIEIANLQTSGHNAPIAVSTLEEARFFSAAGFFDILYAVPIEPGKIPAAIELSRACERLRLITDNLEVVPLLNDLARQAGATLHLLMEVDCGYGRSGVLPDSRANDLAIALSTASNLRFDGLLTHAGHAYNAKSREALLQIAQQERDVPSDLAIRLRRLGIDVPLITIGSTPTINAIDHLDGIHEARPGNYVFYDVFQATLGACSIDACAITVLTAIVSIDRTGGRIVCDAGAIALSKDQGPIEFDVGCGYGRILDLEGNDLGLRLVSLSQEHGVAIKSRPDLLANFKIGARVRILINHSCLTAAQHEHYHVLRNGEVVAKWRRANGW